MKLHVSVRFRRIITISAAWASLMFVTGRITSSLAKQIECTGSETQAGTETTGRYRILPTDETVTRESF